jgi:tripartite-type tricarboxylate transporter receptor subunit TctC
MQSVRKAGDDRFVDRGGRGGGGKDMRIRRWIAVLLGAASLVGATAGARADGFYRGKTIRVLVNFTAGGAADLEARVFARHLGAHLAGSPTLNVENLDGSGGMNGTNYIGKDTSRDGLLLGYLTGAGARAVLTPEAFRVDFRSFEMIGLSPGAAIYFARSDTKPGLKKPEDFVGAQKVFVGGVGASSSKDLTSRLTLDMLGVKHGYIPGYAGTTGAREALVKGEINFYSENRPAYQTLIAPLVASGELMPIYYDPSWDGAHLGVLKSVADLPVSPFQDYFEKVRGRSPSGRLWEAYKTILASNDSLLRMIVAPPGTPKAAVDELRAATAALAHDEAFIAESRKLLGFVPEYVTNTQLDDEVRNMLQITPEMRSFLEGYIANTNE